MTRTRRSTDQTPLPPPRPREALFLGKGTAGNLRTLLRDFRNFTLILVFYASCWLLGSAAFMLDNMFRTRLFERFVCFVERLDHGGHR